MTTRVLLPELVPADGAIGPRSLGEIYTHTVNTTFDHLNDPLGKATTADKTPIFICTFNSCYRLIPDKARLLIHRQKDHSLTTPEADLWLQTITWPEIVKRELAMQSAAASEKQQGKPVSLISKAPEENEVDIYDFEASEEPSVNRADPIRASYLPLPGGPRATPPPIIPQKREAVDEAQEEEEDAEYEPPEATPSSAPESPYEPPGMEEPSRSSSPVVVAPFKTTLPPVEATDAGMMEVEATDAAPTEVESAVPFEPDVDIVDMQTSRQEATQSVTSVEVIPLVAQEKELPLALAVSSGTVVKALPAAMIPAPVYAPPLQYQPSHTAVLPASLSALLASHAAAVAKPAHQPLSYERPTQRATAATPAAVAHSSGTMASLPAKPPSLAEKPSTGPRRTPPPPLPQATSDGQTLQSQQAGETGNRAKPASVSDIQSILAKLKAPPPVSEAEVPSIVSPTPRSPGLGRPSWLGDGHSAWRGQP